MTRLPIAHDSDVSGYSLYRKEVAMRIMTVVDSMPKPYRALVHEYGYVDVYRAWSRGWTPDRILRRVVDGLFVLD
jgi:hypothetical protein